MQTTATQPQLLAGSYNSSSMSSNKNDIKITAEGVAKLTFNFLDESELYGDSSLEPGEVKTPPRESASDIVAMVVANTKAKEAAATTEQALSTFVEEPQRKDSSTVGKVHKTLSQLEAEACQEKVRAILELDAIKRREEAEKRKEQMEKRRRSGELTEEEQQMKKAKEERKRLKKLKKEQKAARLALLSDDENALKELEKYKKRTKSRESYSSTHSSPERSDELRSVNALVPSVVGVPIPSRYNMTLLQPFPDPYMSYRPMNPFIRGSRPDFHVVRGGAAGGYVPRGRGGMRGGIRFPNYRQPFFVSNPGAPSLRHHAPMQRQHTPPPIRGHSPIKAPRSDLHWTKTKPSISYAFNVRQANKTKYEHKSDDSAKSSERKVRRSKDKKSKKHLEREKIKKRRSSRNSSEKSSKQRQIEKIRMSQIRKPEKANFINSMTFLKNKQHPSTQAAISSDSEEMWDIVENIKVEKVDDDDIKKITPPPIELIKDNIKLEKDAKKETELDERVEVSIDNLEATAQNEETNVADSSTPKVITQDNAQDKVFDMFADSPPRSQKPTAKDIENLLQTARKASEIESTSIDPKELNSMDQMKQKHEQIESKVVKLSSKSDKFEIDVRATTPPGRPELRKHSITPPLVKTLKPVEKTALQKAIEIQQRIDKLLQDDELKSESIEAAKEKLLQTSKTLAKETSGKETIPSDKPVTHINPFKRSLSRDRYFGKIDGHRQRSRSRSHTRDHARESSKYKQRPSLEPNRERVRARSKSNHSTSSTSSINRSRSNGGSTTSLNRSHSSDQERKEKHESSKRRVSRSPRVRHYDNSENQKSQSLERSKQKSTAITKIDKDQDRYKYKEKDKQASKKPLKVTTPKKPGVKRQKTTPLSFAAAEFLFPEDADVEENVNSNTKQKFVKAVFTDNDDYDTASSSKNTKTTNAAAASSGDKADVSPDTDDYMDNWENDDADLDLNFNVTCEGSTPLRSSQEDADDKYVTRFVNPSPPVMPLKLIQPIVKTEKELESTTPTNSPPVSHFDNNKDQTKQLRSAKSLTPPIPSVGNKQLFGMQELYDQFIKSVEETGVDMNSTTMQSSPKRTSEPPTIKQEVLETFEQNDEHLSTSSTTTSSTSTSSSSSDDSNSSSSSSTSSASSSDESNDADVLDHSLKTKRQSQQTTPSPSAQLSANEQVVEVGSAQLDDKLITTTPPKPIGVNIKGIEKSTIPLAPPTPQPLSSNMTDATSVPPSMPTPAIKAQKSDVTRDFKKLKSLEANLARIQMMRANYDSTDEISEELLKMENLFLQEKNLILQKYAKSISTAIQIPISTPTLTKTGAGESKPAEVNLISTGTMPNVTSQITQTLQHVVVESEIGSEAESQMVTNKIFDANREAIKLTISPLKLPRTPAIFESAAFEEDVIDKSKRTCESEETEDFTEKLSKPVKEIAIVKPMMESKDARSQQQQHRRSPMSSLSRTAHERPRSPSGGYRSRRSNSRSRLHSPQRRGRVRSLSVSPQRRGGRDANARNLSPQRRGNYATQARYRNSNRRSRSRSRSITKQSNRRTGGESRRRQPTAMQSCYYRKTPGQQRPFRDSRSRSRSRSPQQSHHHRSPRPHSPRSPRPHSPRSPPPQGSVRRRSYSRERYSPLPFKPPSPPMRRSLSPASTQRRPNSLSPPQSRNSSSRLSRSHSRSRSPHMPRSPRSPRSPPPTRYDDHSRRRHGSNFERRSISPQHQQYYSQDSSNSSYYYNVSPNRISLDARINIVLNGPAAGQENASSTNITSYESYSNYSQYSGAAAYMSIPPQPHVDNTSNYYANQYVPIATSGIPAHHAQHGHQQMYSNIPTISGAGNTGTSSQHLTATSSAHYYYNSEYGDLSAAASSAQHQHQTPSLLKELPKATVAVQKGNVLEIVPSNEVPESAAAASSTSSSTNKAGELAVSTKAVKTKSVSFSWKEEVNSRHITAAVLRLSRENSGAQSILKKLPETEAEMSKENKLPRKKVYFEDGIFPNRDSGDEDRKVIDAEIRNKIRRLRKQRGITIAAGNLVSSKPTRDKPKIDLKLEKLPPPPPPACPLPAGLEQPICMRPPTPLPPLYFHFDAVVHSMYVSQLDRPIPPRLLNPKSVPSNGSGAASVTSGAGTVATASNSVTPPVATQSPSHVQSPSNTFPHLHTASKKDLGALAAINRSGRNGRASPKQTPSNIAASAATIQRRENLPTAAQSPIAKSSFHTIAAGSGALSPQTGGTHALPSQRQGSPLGFVGMRMRLPPSPLARGNGPATSTPPPQQQNIPVMMRGNFNMPPPNMLPLQVAGSIMPPNEFVGHHHQQQQQYSSHHIPYNAPPPTHQHHHFNAALPPHAQHLNHHNHRQPPPQHYFMQTAPPLPPTSMSGQHKNPGKDLTLMQQSSPQAMVAPYNIKRP